MRAEKKREKKERDRDKRREKREERSQLCASFFFYLSLGADLR